MINDFIAPRLFTVCGSCGKMWRIGERDFFCAACLQHLVSRNMDKQERNEHLQTITIEKAVSKAVSGAREILAKEIKKNGIPPRYWLSDRKKELGCTAKQEKATCTAR